MSNLTHLSLFSGIGGIDLASDKAGFRTIAQVEQNDYCRRILEKHWPGVPRFNDVRDVTADSLRAAGIEFPTLISGGFPCQPFSCAGKRRGSSDDRYLWPEMLRIVQELRPAWVLGENVAGFVGMALDQVQSDLERAGYQVRAFLVPAAGVNAPHKRDRCFIVANSSIARSGGLSIRSGESKSSQIDARRKSETVANTESIKQHGARDQRRGGIESSDCGIPLANSDKQRLQGHGGSQERPCELPSWAGSRALEDEWLSRSRICRLSHGVSNRVAKLKALGNAVVPMQIYPFLRAIADIENGAIS